MAIQLTKIDDRSDSFAVEFSVVNTYKRTFPPRDPTKDQVLYARECVQSIVSNPVEKPDGVIIKTQPVPVVVDENKVIDLDEPKPDLEP
jgi:hypothetical protein